MKLLLLSATALFVALLAGCGGGDDGSTADAGVPSSALASTDDFSRYVGSLQADDRAEPVSLDRLVPPVSDSAEPVDG